MAHGASGQNWSPGPALKRTPSTRNRGTDTSIVPTTAPLCLYLVLYFSIALTHANIEVSSYLLPRPYVCAAVAVEGGATARAPLSVWPTGGVGSALAQGVANLAQAVVGRHDAISWAVNGRLRRERRPCSIAALEINSTQRDTHEVGVVGAPIVCIRGVRVTVCSIADFPSTVTQPHQGR